MTRLLLTVIAMLLAPAAAAAQTGGFERVGFGLAEPPVVSPDTGLAAYAASGVVVVLPESGEQRIFALPGCSPKAVSPVNVALLCTTDGGPSELRVLDLRTDAVTTVDTAGLRGDPSGAIAVGSRWVYAVDLYVAEAAAKAFPAHGLIDLGTGRLINLAQDPFGRRERLDLNRARPAAALCRPARRYRSVNDYGGPKFAPVTALGRWALTTTGTGTQVLTDCKRHSNVPLKLGISESVQINRSWLLKQGFDTLELRRLGARSRRALTPPPDSTALLGERVIWVSDRGGLLYRYRLPR